MTKYKIETIYGKNKHRPFEVSEEEFTTWLKINAMISGDVTITATYDADSNTVNYSVRGCY